MNKIAQIIEKPNFMFKPNQTFYASIGIGRKRFWKLVRNEVSPKIDEIRAIADYFNVNPQELIEF